MPSTDLSKEISLAITSLKWTPDGELCAEDRLIFFRRLMGPTYAVTAARMHAAGAQEIGTAAGHLSLQILLGLRSANTTGGG
jgi:hypothetical protein